MSSQSHNPAAAPQFLDSPVEPSGEHKPRRSTSQLSTQSLAFIEQQYADYLHDRNAVSPDWRDYFDDIHAGHEDVTAAVLQTPFRHDSIFHRQAKLAGGQAASSETAILQERLDQLIRNYRVRGHIIAQIDPLHAKRPEPPELDPAFYGFTDEHMGMEFSTQWFGGAECRTLGDMLQWLQMTYCRSIGVQFMHIDSLQVRSWLRDRMERSGNRIRLSRDEQIRILTRLSDAVMFEEFIQKKYVGAKSFSLEGAESLIPLLDMAIERAGEQGIDLVVMGMAHRGRLNVLANIMGKRPSRIFREFEDKDPELQMGRGDVKYHLGYSSDWTTTTGKDVHLTLCFNPSHLEFVNPVALGRLRAKQDHREDYERRRSMGILIHGDAAFAGEGVAQETLNLSELSGYRTGGTLHIIVNNQVGFTTSPSEGRSCTYATDVARMLQIPIFHVNGEDPEAVAQVVQLAMEFRDKFQRDVIIDMYCFRRRGHNEGDEPAFTQPTMYQMIRKRKTVFENYLASMLKLEGLTREEANEIVERRTQILEEELEEARKDKFAALTDSGGGTWKDFFGGPVANADDVDTAIEAAELQRVVDTVSTPPKGFTPHPRLVRILQQRRQMGAGEQPFDWGTAELAALGSLVAEGFQLRFSGQDVRRGTFSHRHAALHDAKDGRVWMGVQDLAARPELVEFHNSPLSEIGVLGFEYGYSLDRPHGITLWEAQFGDFVNVAQVIIDQFISSAEDKWKRLSGLVMLLPHGFEGQGPEHSSARLERFLTLAAEDNMQIVAPTTPAQHFHLLRRQSLRKWKKPLVVMTPKSLLRHKEAVSPASEFTSGHFQEVIADDLANPEGVKRILLCSGKIFYELHSVRKESGRDDVAILRVEQLYPFPEAELRQKLSVYGKDVPVFWVQEEPRNMGAWPSIRIRFGDSVFDTHQLTGITRVESASPATGSGTSHKIEQQAILKEALEIS
ncbi:2-oxoglutarate dehydrogenase E1 component [Fuerstiella marisgermanici]|uniref:oxoglutarate dehydrogenase (succinyl-transferring) n=1 Tax=Fuerstiella marisgermanici TaxID=1891926 RepID=A0A1P8WSH1_9PLAN|nr:2-oxoglutarate dehydrogenase E1 component [Fuerstiella marisgermanici]APZ96999.1 2-oxoglutarate dehydrogenase E1 component [Fuerstiella marisgermanici]